jgi:hypothetical protein
MQTEQKEEKKFKDKSPEEKEKEWELSGRIQFLVSKISEMADEIEKTAGYRVVPLNSAVAILQEVMRHTAIEENYCVLKEHSKIYIEQKYQQIIDFANGVSDSDDKGKA